jgi:putative ABC transport system ATP-binding protein
MESASAAAVVNAATSYGPIISAQHLGKVYGSGKLKVEALRDVTFDVAPGEFVAIVGPSGSGKSTLFYILGGLTSATSGSLLIQGRDFSRLSDSQRTSLRRSQIGFVFQRFNLLPTVSAQANIELAHEIAATGKPFDQQLLDHLSDLLKIQGRLHHRPNELSGGEQQRVAIARALITRPSIVLADEPTGNLDTATGNEIMALFERLYEEGNTIVLVTHEHDIAMHAHRIISIRDGKVERDEKVR